jgi:sec-independent protein translocase protein TatB
MVDLGFWEFAIIFVVIILVFGPERIPELAKTIGNWYAKIMRLAHNARRDFERELNLTDLHKLIQEQRQQIQRLQNEMQTVKREFDSDILADANAASSTTNHRPEAAAQAEKTAEEGKNTTAPAKPAVLSPAEIAAASNAELLKQHEEEMAQAKVAPETHVSTPAPVDSKNNA